MKMAPGVFWGIIFIVIGIVVIIKVVFNVDIPLFRIIFASILIMIGVKVLIGPSHGFKYKSNLSDSEDVIFGEQEHHNINELQKEYNIVFGKGYYNFSNIDTVDYSSKTIFNIVFGSAIIKLNPDIPVQIKCDAVFSGVKFPDGHTAVFGTNYYRSPSFNETKPYLQIKIDAVFSGLEIIY